MDETTLFDELTFLGYSIPEVIKFNGKELSNYRIAYNGKIIASLKELISKSDSNLLFFS